MTDHPLPPLAQQRCEPRDAPLPAPEQQRQISQLTGWAIEAPETGGVLQKSFKFKNFHRTMAFVNAVAWIAHEQDHHPDMAVSYNRCTLRWSTHSAAGLTLNDFICAARVDALSA